MAGILDWILPRLIQHESGWNPNAVSPKGAFGLGQSMPATARNPGFGVKPYNPSAPNIPDEQIRFARDYLGAMYKRYSDPVKALVAYNWGPGNADKWGGDLSKLPRETYTSRTT